MDIDWNERGKEVVEEYRHNIAEAINCLDRSHEVFEHVANEIGWNDDITMLVTEAKVKLGSALAALTLWYDEEEPEAVSNADHRKQRGRTAPNSK